MSTYLLFCTAIISTAKLTTLLQTPHHNPFSLVRGPHQTTFDDPCTQPPITAFETGFLHNSSLQIRSFLATNLPTNPPHSNLEPGQYALLDARSESDGTVVIGHAFSPLLMRDVDEMGEEERVRWEVECDGYDEQQAGDQAWREWRVRFEEAERIATVLSFEDDFTVKLYNDSFVAAYTDADGVFRLGEAFRAYADQPGEDG